MSHTGAFKKAGDGAELEDTEGLRTSVGFDSMALTHGERNVRRILCGRRGSWCDLLLLFRRSTDHTIGLSTFMVDMMLRGLKHV